MTGTTRVDVLSLEDFHLRLAERLAEAESVVRRLRTDLGCRPPQLGTFADATSNARRYTTVQLAYLERAERLRDAVRAAHSATGTILGNYRTTEARNQANARDISAALAGVGEALEGGRDV